LDLTGVVFSIVLNLVLLVILEISGASGNVLFLDFFGNNSKLVNDFQRVAGSILE